MVNVIYLVVSLIFVFVAYVVRNVVVSELDLANYMIAKASKLFISDVYPKNSTSDILHWRQIIEKSSYDSGLLWHGKSTDVTIREDNLSIRIYNPQAPSAKVQILRPVILWFHGGGWVLGSIDTDNTKCKLLANSTNSIIVSVNYRLAPEFPYPAALEDAALALRWTKQDIAKFGGDRERISIAGESAGGNIAAALTALNFDSSSSSLGFNIPKIYVKLQHLILVYPCMQKDSTSDSHFRYSDTNGLLTLKQMQWFWSLYTNNSPGGCTSYALCPLLTPERILKKFPKTTIILAKHDVLLDEGVEFHQKLTAVGVPSNIIVFNDSVHGFFLSGGVPSGEKALKYLVRQIPGIVVSVV